MRELVLALVKRDLKARYRRSLLGFAWSLLRPAFLTLVLWGVFSGLLRADMAAPGAPYWLHLLVSVLTWNYLLGAVTEATHSVVANGNLLKKTPLDAAVFPAAAVAGQTIHYGLAMAVAVPVALLAGARPGFGALLALPAVVAVAASLAMAVGMLLAAAQVRFRDTGSALELAGMAWFYATPVLYGIDKARATLSARPASGAGDGGAWLTELYLANPAAPIMAGVRRATLGTAEMPDSELALRLGAVAAFSMVALAAARALYARVAPDFADQL